VAGAQGLTGAACLCGEAAARAGAGLVTVAAPASVHDILEVKLTEVMTAPLPDEGGKVAATAVEHLPELAAGCGALAVGPGLGVSAGVKKVVASCLALDVPLVIDADGLNVLAGMVEIIKSRNKATVLTPHPGEAARLLGRDTAAVQAARLQAGCDLAECSGAVVVLKGAGTLVVAPDGRYAVNPVANPALASGGSGDVLTGLVVALLGNGLEAFAAACAAVFWHGAAAQLAAAGADRGMLAGDIISHLAAALRRVVQTPDEVLPYVRMMPLGAQGVKRLDD
jgi:NAD(P)H-hydrate epimerase